MKIKFGKLYNLKIYFILIVEILISYFFFSKKFKVFFSKIVFHNFYKIFFKINKLKKKIQSLI